MSETYVAVRAEPGWFLITKDGWRLPIIAWAIELYGAPNYDGSGECPRAYSNPIIVTEDGVGTPSEVGIKSEYHLVNEVLFPDVELR